MALLFGDFLESAKVFALYLVGGIVGVSAILLLIGFSIKGIKNKRQKERRKSFNAEREQEKWEIKQLKK